MYTVRESNTPIGVIASVEETTEDFNAVLDYAAAKLGLPVAEVVIETEKDKVLFCASREDVNSISLDCDPSTLLTTSLDVGHARC